MDKLHLILLCVYGAVNLVVFIMYGADKSKAKRDKWRIPESTLIFAAVLGIIGALAGMIVFHHKTRKPKFSVGLPLILAAEAAIAFYITQKM
ncbi:DUF1294 domain-containing protein [Ruminococcus sp.]|uniref:DUF1294 domain-containing protein n=1 Tax=Ruminococcus sp. TaxID=41978 RepID=UPI0025D7F765|nr:DUF1294 domain-containing protein [Ruminococcus sp.]MBQ8965788.1 DUF1294 domain-containing protein [Ruminococcus sp.]